MLYFKKLCFIVFLFNLSPLVAQSETYYYFLTKKYVESSGWSYEYYKLDPNASLFYDEVLRWKNLDAQIIYYYETLGTIGIPAWADNDYTSLDGYEVSHAFKLALDFWTDDDGVFGFLREYDNNNTSVQVMWQPSGYYFGGKESLHSAEVFPVVCIDDDHLKSSDYINSTIGSQKRVWILFNSDPARGFYWAINSAVTSSGNYNKYLYLPNIMNHEVGHLIGLGHNPATCSIMRENFTTGDYTNSTDHHLRIYTRCSTDDNNYLFLKNSIMIQSGGFTRTPLLNSDPQIGFMTVKNEIGVTK